MDYLRRLTEAEQSVVDEWEERDAAAEWAAEAARRDCYFGFAADEVFPPKTPETYETSAEAAADSRATGGLAAGPDGGRPSRTRPMARLCRDTPPKPHLHLIRTQAPMPLQIDVRLRYSRAFPPGEKT